MDNKNQTLADQDEQNLREAIHLDKNIILGLSLMLGVALPLLVRNIFDTVRNKRLLHVANAIHSIMYILLSGTTLLFRVVAPDDCVSYRRVQAVVFHVYVLAYEFVLAYKAKTIIGRKKLFSIITYADALFAFAIGLRITFAVGTILTTKVEYAKDRNHGGTCVNKYDQIWLIAGTITRNMQDLLWSLLFVIPIYRVMSSSSQHRFYEGIRSMPYRKIFVANCMYPLLSFVISFSISVALLIAPKTLANWMTLLLGTQNFVGTYAMNMILNIKVSVDDDDQDSSSKEVTNESFYENETPSMYIGKPPKAPHYQQRPFDYERSMVMYRPNFDTPNGSHYSLTSVDLDDNLGRPLQVYRPAQSRMYK